MVIILTSQVKMIVTELVKDYLLQVFLIKFGVHQRVDVDVVINQVVSAPRRPQSGVEYNPV